MCSVLCAHKINFLQPQVPYKITGKTEKLNEAPKYYSTQETESDKHWSDMKYIKWIHYCHLWCCFIVTHYNNICQIYQPLVLINPCWYIFESDWSILEYQKYGSVVQVTSYLHMTAAAELRPLTADCARTRLPSGEGSAPRAAARNTRPGPWCLSAAHPLQWACSAPARWYEHFVSQISTLVLAQSR